MTKSEGSYGLGHIYWRVPQWKTLFFVYVVVILSTIIKTLSSYITTLLTFQLNLNNINPSIVDQF